MATLTSSCVSTDKYEATEISTALENRQTLNQESIGVDSEGDIIVQKEQSAAAALAMMRRRNEMVLDELSYEQTELDICRTYLADPRLGGTGDIRSIAVIDSVQNVSVDREEIGIASDGNIKVVSKRYYRDELEGERRHSENLKQILTLARAHRSKCESKLKTARLEYGLPSERIMPEGYFTADGTWIQIKQGEQTLDDAFEIMAKRKVGRNR